MNILRIFLLIAFSAGFAHAQAPNGAAPAAPAESARAETRNWLAAVDAQWQAVYKRDVVDVHAAELGKLKQQYAASLAAALATASSASDLKGALALRDEQKRFADTSAFPAQDATADPAPLKQLRAAGRAQLARLEKENASRVKALHAKYDQVLAQTQAQLTQHQQLDDALLVQTKRDEVTAAWITPAVAAADKPVPPATPPAVAQSTATPAPATPKTGFGTIPAPPGTKSAFDAQLQKLTRSAWTWETVMGKNTIKFEKDGTCVHTRFNGTFEIQKDDTVVVNLPTRQQVLVFDFGKGEFNGYDSVLKQKITGKRTNQK